MDETIPDVGFSIGTIQRKKTSIKDTNRETFWNNFDKIIYKLKPNPNSNL